MYEEKRPSFINIIISDCHYMKEAWFNFKMFSLAKSHLLHFFPQNPDVVLSIHSQFSLFFVFFMNKEV